MTVSYAGHVPIRVIAPIIRDWMSTYTVLHDEQGANRYPENRYVRHQGGEGCLEVLGFQAKVSPRQLRRILSGKISCVSGGRKYEADYINFDAADKIITAIDHTLWYRKPLSDFYGPLEVTHGELKRGLVLPEGFDFDSLPQPKKYLWLNARQRMKEAA